MDDNTSVIPQHGSNEHSVIDNLIRRSVREVQQLQPNITFDELMEHHRICTLMEFIEQQIKSAFDLPSLFINEMILAAYQDEEFWTLHEAVCLSCGIDPFRFQHLQSRFDVMYHDRYAANFQYILLNMQPESVECMVPEKFCSWALEQNIVHESVTDFFQDIKHRY